MPSVECYNNKLIDDFFDQPLTQRQTGILFMGGAGFYIKTVSGESIMIDPYLSDCAEERVSFKRLLPRIFDPNYLRPDLLLCSHEHPDHLDVIAVPEIMSNEHTLLCTTPTGAANPVLKAIDSEHICSMHRGERITFQNIEIHAVFSDHGELSPDAIGFVITTPDIKIYFTGDTSLCDEVKHIAIVEKPDLILPPINGMYGNLNEEEAAELCELSGAKWVIPCHFGLFVEHGANPLLFANAMKERGRSFHFLGMGESIIL